MGFQSFELAGLRFASGLGLTPRHLRANTCFHDDSSYARVGRLSHTVLIELVDRCKSTQTCSGRNWRKVVLDPHELMDLTRFRLGYVLE